MTEEKLQKASYWDEVVVGWDSDSRKKEVCSNGDLYLGLLLMPDKLKNSGWLLCRKRLSRCDSPGAESLRPEESRRPRRKRTKKKEEILEGGSRRFLRSSRAWTYKDFSYYPCPTPQLSYPFLLGNVVVFHRPAVSSQVIPGVCSTQRQERGCPRDLLTPSPILPPLGFAEYSWDSPEAKILVYSLITLYQTACSRYYNSTFLVGVPNKKIFRNVISLIFSYF